MTNKNIYVNIYDESIPELERTSFEGKGVGYSPKNPKPLEDGTTVEDGATNDKQDNSKSVQAKPQVAFEQSQNGGTVTAIGGEFNVGKNIGGGANIQVLDEPGTDGQRITGNGEYKLGKVTVGANIVSTDVTKVDGTTESNVTGEISADIPVAELLKLPGAAAPVALALDAAEKAGIFEAKVGFAGGFSQGKIVSPKDASMSETNNYHFKLNADATFGGDNLVISGKVHGDAGVEHSEKVQLTIVDPNTGLVSTDVETAGQGHLNAEATVLGFTDELINVEGSIDIYQTDEVVVCNIVHGVKSMNSVEDTVQAEDCDKYMDILLDLQQKSELAQQTKDNTEPENQNQVYKNIISYNILGSHEVAGNITREDITKVVESKTAAIDVMDGNPKPDGKFDYTSNELSEEEASRLQADFQNGQDILNKLKHSDIAPDDKIYMSSLFNHLVDPNEDGMTSEDILIDVEKAVNNPDKYSNITAKEFADKYPDEVVMNSHSQETFVYESESFHQTVTAVIIAKEEEPNEYTEEDFQIGAR